MNRTSMALRRLGVPVLAATTLLTAGQIALGTTSAFAAVNGTLTITPDPAYGTSTPVPPATGQTPDQTVTYTAGTGSGAAGDAAQTITLSVSGSAVIIQPTTQVAGSTLTIAAGGKSASCTTAATAGGPPKTASCAFSTTDNVSEAVTVTANDTTDVTTPSATATNNFAGLHWNNCPSTAPDTTANCVTQTSVGTQSTYTVKYLAAGQPAQNVSVTFNVIAGTAQMSPTQPAGTAFFSATQANCITNAQGECSVTIIQNSAGTSDIQAQTSNTGNYPASRATQRVNVIASTAPGRLVQTSSTLIKPSTQASNANQPGDAVQNTYTLYPCAAGTSTGNNACAADTANPLSGVSVALSVDHGFFTPNCTSSDPSATTNYANCTFDPAPAATKPVGNLKSLGKTLTVTTAANGTFTVTLGIGKDTAFDQTGDLTAVVTGVANGVTLVESQGTGNSPTGTACPAPGCSTGTPWTTDVAPLNGGSVKIVSVPNSSSEPALDDTKNNNVPTQNSNTRVFVLHLTDQFGNLTSGGTQASLASTGVGELERCTNYTASNTCSATSTAGSVVTTDSSGVPTRTYTTSVSGSYLAPFTSGGGITQDRFMASNPADVAGLQTIKATWAAPTTTFNTFSAGTAASPAVATYTTGTNTVTDTVVINWYDQNAQPVVTFSTTPSNKVGTGTVVTVSATVKDQFGNPIKGDGVQFVRSGPTTNNGTSCTATNGFSNTNAAGQAGFSFTCNNASKQLVTIVVQDASGNELARGTQTITFGSPTTAKQHPFLNCWSPRAHVLKCKVVSHPRVQGATVKFRRVHRDGTFGKVIAVRTTNSNGVAKFTKRHLKSGKIWRVIAHVSRVGNVRGGYSNVDKTRIK